jgi:hypothetical protein
VYRSSECFAAARFFSSSEKVGAPLDLARS